MSSPSSGRSHQLSLAKLERDTYVRVYFVRDGVAGAAIGVLKGLTRTDARIADASGAIVEIPFASMTQVSAPDLDAASESQTELMPAMLSVLAVLVLIVALATLVYGTRQLTLWDIAFRVIGVGAPVGYLVGARFSDRIAEERRGFVLEVTVGCAIAATWIGMYVVRRVPALRPTLRMLAVIVVIAGIGALVGALVATSRKLSSRGA